MKSISLFSLASRRMLASICGKPMRTELASVNTSRYISTSSPKNAALEYSQRRRELREQQSRRQNATAIEQQRHRRWQTGDVYAPHDLGPMEQKKWKNFKAPNKDAFDALNINPLDLYKNFSVLSEYTTDMGRIKHSSQTGLRPVNQRKIAKAIRRAVGLGIMPSTHSHPEILKKEIAARIRRGLPF